jgi:hypothetical protein
MPTTLIPPRDAAPYKRFVLRNGTLCKPDFARNGAVTVNDDSDVNELLAEGWTLSTESQKAARSTDNLLRKAVAAEARRAGVYSRTECGELNVCGLVTVAHDQGSDTVAVSGVTFELSDIDPDLRAGFKAASAAFNAAKDATEQGDALSLIGIVTSAILKRHDFIGARVRERKFDQRWRA